jgi:hypothetical protein
MGTGLITADVQNVDAGSLKTTSSNLRYWIFRIRWYVIHGFRTEREALIDIPQTIYSPHAPPFSNEDGLSKRPHGEYQLAHPRGCQEDHDLYSHV